jgi:hypothetical protein
VSVEDVKMTGGFSRLCLSKILFSPTLIYLSVRLRPEPSNHKEKRKRNKIAIHAVVTEAAVPLILTMNQMVAIRQIIPSVILRIFPSLVFSCRSILYLLSVTFIPFMQVTDFWILWFAVLKSLHRFVLRRIFLLLRFVTNFNLP